MPFLLGVDKASLRYALIRDRSFRSSAAAPLVGRFDGSAARPSVQQHCQGGDVLMRQPGASIAENKGKTTIRLPVIVDR